MLCMRNFIEGERASFTWLASSRFTPRLCEGEAYDLFHLYGLGISIVSVAAIYQIQVEDFYLLE